MKTENKEVKATCSTTEDLNVGCMNVGNINVIKGDAEKRYAHEFMRYETVVSGNYDPELVSNGYFRWTLSDDSKVGTSFTADEDMEILFLSQFYDKDTGELAVMPYFEVEFDCLVMRANTNKKHNGYPIVDFGKLVIKPNDRRIITLYKGDIVSLNSEGHHYGSRDVPENIRISIHGSKLFRVLLNEQ